MTAPACYSDAPRYSLDLPIHNDLISLNISMIMLYSAGVIPFCRKSAQIEAEYIHLSPQRILLSSLTSFS